MPTPAAPSSATPLSPADWAAVKALFAAAVAQPAAARDAFVAAAEVAGPVRTEVSSLLALERATADASFLQVPAAALGGAAPARIGERLGPWQIVAELGAGGMGEVFEARRADGSYEGRAAVKLLRRGTDSAAVLRRFAQERQSLARLQHAHIAALFDAGLSGDGLPYFVMELVDGEPIDVAVRGLPVERRLELFLQLADAVSFAHRNLLVHRDLKPGNVLVDTAGQVKLLDFGIAQAIDAEGGEGGDTTFGRPPPFTPNYASPEQIRGDAVSTGTDIYSLGVLLYQLLTGVRPTGRNAASLADAARSVLDETPTRPSSLPGQITGDPHWLATRRRLAGDLDNVLLKALEKPVERRYASVDAMAADIRAFLTGFPVGARAPTWRYIGARFVARHRVTVAAAALAAVALVAGAAVAAWQAHEATLARDDARARLAELRGVMHELVFRFGDGIAYLPGGMAIKEDLLEGTLAQLEKLAGTAAVDAAIVADIASLHARLAELQGADTSASTGRPARAGAHADRAIALGADVWDERKADRPFVNWLARAYVVRAKLERAAGHPEQGLQTLAAARARVEESLALQTRDDERLWLLQNLADDLFLEAQFFDAFNLPSLDRPQEAVQRLDAAEQAYRRQLALGDAVFARLDAAARPEEPKTKAGLLHALASAEEGRALLRLKHDEPALGLADAEEAARTELQALAADPLQSVWHDGVMRKFNTLATTALRLGQGPAALEAAQRSWNEAVGLVKSEGAQSMWATALPSLAQQYGRALAANGRHAEAVPVFEQAIAFWSAQSRGQAPTQAQSRAAPPANPNAQRRADWMRVQLSRSLQALGRRDEARRLAREASAGLDSLTRTSPTLRDAWLALGEALAWQGEIDAGDDASQRESFRAAARAAYGRAASLAPLKADHAAARAALD